MAMIGLYFAFINVSQHNRIHLDVFFLALNDCIAYTR